MTPSTIYPDAISGAIIELLSAQSALNMEPKKLPSPSGPYLADTDYWAKHSMDHMNAVFELLNRAAVEKVTMMNRLVKLEEQVKNSHRIQQIG